MRRHLLVYARKTRCCHHDRQVWQEKGTKMRKLPENFPIYGEEFVKSCVCNTTYKK